MKKALKYLWIFLLPLCLLACGDDDKGPGKDSDKGSVSPNSSIIGTWQWEDDDDVTQFVFNPNATFKEIEWWKGDKAGTISVEKGTFTFNDKTGKLVLRYEYDDDDSYEEDEPEYRDIEFIDDDTMIMTDNEGYYYQQFFYRVK